MGNKALEEMIISLRLGYGNIFVVQKAYNYEALLWHTAFVVLMQCWFN